MAALMATQEGAEQYGSQFPTGNISAEQMAELDARAAKVDASEEDRQRFMENQTKSYGKRKWN
jgi:hypothetical protein